MLFIMPTFCGCIPIGEPTGIFIPESTGFGAGIWKSDCIGLNVGDWTISGVNGFAIEGCPIPPFDPNIGFGAGITSFTFIKVGDSTGCP